MFFFDEDNDSVVFFCVLRCLRIVANELVYFKGKFKIRRHKAQNKTCSILTVFCGACSLIIAKNSVISLSGAQLPGEQAICLNKHLCLYS